MLQPDGTGLRRRKRRRAGPVRLRGRKGTGGNRPVATFGTRKRGRAPRRRARFGEPLLVDAGALAVIGRYGGSGRGAPARSIGCEPARDQPPYAPGEHRANGRRVSAPTHTPRPPTVATPTRRPVTRADTV